MESGNYVGVGKKIVGSAAGGWIRGGVGACPLRSVASRCNCTFGKCPYRCRPIFD